MLSNTLMQIKLQVIGRQRAAPQGAMGTQLGLLEDLPALGALQQTLEPQTFRPSAGRGRGPSLALRLALSSSSDGSILPQAASVLPQAGTLPEVLPQGI